MNISPDGIAITKRFFLALDVLITQKRIRGLNTFTTKHDMNYWNLCTLRKDPNIRVLKPECLSYLVRDFDVSAEWLLTGNGSMFTISAEELQQSKNRPKK